MVLSPKGDISRASRPQNASSWHLYDLPMAHYEFSPVIANRCCIPAEARKVRYSHPGRPLPATVLSADQKLACTLPEGRDLPLLVPITALFAPRVQGNTLVDWDHTYASMANSACWICTELPLSTSAGLPWCISPASVSNWTWLQNQWNSAYPQWNVTWTDIYAGAKQQYDWPRQLSGYSIWDGLG